MLPLKYIFTVWFLVILKYKLLPLPWILIMVPAAGKQMRFEGSCYLEQGLHTNTYSYSKPGDIILGGIVQMQDKVDIPSSPRFEDRPYHQSILAADAQLYRHYLAAIFAIEEINKRNDILPNITLGYEIYNPLNSDLAALDGTMAILSGGSKSIPNYSCARRGFLAGFIGSLGADKTYLMSLLTQLYNYPQISYGSMDEVFTNRLQFPYLYRTVPNERYLHQAIVQLLNYFGWTWVGILATDDYSCLWESQEIKKLITSHGGCVAFLLQLKRNHENINVISEVAKSSANVVVVTRGVSKYFANFLHHYYSEHHPDKVWIINFNLKFRIEIPGTFSVLLSKEEIFGLKEFLHNASPSKYPGDCVIQLLWNILFFCEPKTNDSYFPLCLGNETLKSIPSYRYDINNFRYTHSVYVAIYLLVSALDKMLSHKPFTGINSKNHHMKTRHHILKV